MNGNGDIDIEKSEDPTTVVSRTGVDDGQSLRRRRASDPGAQAANTAPQRPEEYTFKGRHTEMIAIGLSIGTGVLYNSGNYLYWGGPGSLLLSYLLMWTVLYAVMMSLREMITPLPIPGAVFTMSNRVLCHAIGFATGWIYFLAYAIDFPNKVSSAAGFVMYWKPDSRYLPLFITIFIIFTVFFNFLYVRKLGEIEYILTLSKIITILGLIAVGLLLAMGLSTNPLLGTSSQYDPVFCIKNEIGNCVPSPGVINWREIAFKPLFGSKVAGFWKCCTLAVFSFTGCEAVGITADEVERQKETLPRACDRVTHRIGWLYMLAVFILGMNLYAGDPLLSQGIDNKNTFPGGFIVMLLRANIPILPSIVNTIMILAVIGVANADLYVASRCLYALARERHAPSFLADYTWGGVPYLALISAALFGPLAFLSSATSELDIFQLFSSVTSTAILIAWGVICATYLRFRASVKMQKLEQRLYEQRAPSPLQPYLAWYGLFMCTFSVLFAGFETFSHHDADWSVWALGWGYTIAPYMVIAGFVGLIILARLFFGRSAFRVEPKNLVDLHTGRAQNLERLQGSKSKWRPIKFNSAYDWSAGLSPTEMSEAKNPSLTFPAIYRTQHRQRPRQTYTPPKMDMTLLGVIIGAIVIMFLVRGVGFFAARNAARNTYRNGMNAEITGQRRRRIRHTEPRPPEQVYLGGENRYERGPGMEAPPAYSKEDAPPDYGEFPGSRSSHQATSS